MDFYMNRLAFYKQKYNYNPRVIYDIGAYEGEFTNRVKEIFPSATVVQFEANTDKRNFIPDAFFCLLSDKDNKSHTFYKTNFPIQTGNSIYKENSSAFSDENCIKEELTSVKLETLVDSYRLQLPSFMKLDTQGSELNILKGFDKYLHIPDMILMEISIQQYNENSPLFSDVIKYMESKDFLLFDIGGTNYVDSVLIQIDGFFVKRNSEFWNSTRFF